MLARPIQTTTTEELKKEKLRRKITREFETFFRTYPPAPDYIYGRHTTQMLHEMQDVANMRRQGLDTFRIYSIPFRHGKSDVCTKRFPEWYACNFPDDEFIIAAYNYDLATEFSFEARRIFRDTARLWHLTPDEERGSVGSWRIKNHRGAVHAAGIRGTITGKGSTGMVIDDPFKNREEAESENIRDRVWEAFAGDLMTRRAPTSFVVIVANRWHEDDIVGRIKERNDPASKFYDPDFPIFEETRFPAQCESYITEDNPEGWLFPERFSPAWYRSQRSTLGTYAWNAQGLQDPQPRTGNFLDVSKVVRVNSFPEGLEWFRGWDVASTEKERAKEDPDYTVGTLAAYDPRTRILYVKDVIFGQWSALKRDRMIIQTALQDGPSVKVRIETAAGYKDVFNKMRHELRGAATVYAFTPKNDKLARASCLEPIFEAGNVRIMESNWNSWWLRQVGSFPGGKHDDAVDSVVVAVYDTINRGHSRPQVISFNQFGRSYA